MKSVPEILMWNVAPENALFNILRLGMHNSIHVKQMTVLRPGLLWRNCLLTSRTPSVEQAVNFKCCKLIVSIT